MTPTEKSRKSLNLGHASGSKIHNIFDVPRSESDPRYCRAGEAKAQGIPKGMGERDEREGTAGGVPWARERKKN